VRCNTCGEDKAFEELAKDKSKKSGRRGRCYACQRDYWKSWRLQNVEHVRAKTAQWKERNPDKVKSSQRKRFYGLTDEAFRALGEVQGWRCAICDVDITEAPCVDHDHETGAIRNLLCRRCNSGLGMFGDSSARLSAAAAYLDKWRTDGSQAAG
jgi:hypothetical protein